MDAREARRLKLTRDAMKAMRVKGFREAFSSNDGSEAIIFVAMPDDTIRLVSDRIAEMGGSAHLIVASSADELGPFTILRLDVTPSRTRPVCPSRTEFLVKASTELGMIVDACKLSSHLTVYVCPNNEATFELVDDGGNEALV